MATPIDCDLPVVGSGAASVQEGGPVITAEEALR